MTPSECLKRFYAQIEDDLASNLHDHLDRQEYIKLLKIYVDQAAKGWLM